VIGEEALDPLSSLGRELDDVAAAVLGVTLAPHPALGGQLVDDERDVRAAGQELLADVALPQRTEMQEHLQDPELRFGQADARQLLLETAADRARGADEFDERVERPNPGTTSAIVGSHASPPGEISDYSAMIDSS
jgi:hypothetical protein